MMDCAINHKVGALRYTQSRELGLLNFFAAIFLIFKKRVLGWITLIPLVAILYPVSASMIAYAHLADSILTYHRYLLLILPLAALIDLVALFLAGSSNRMAHGVAPTAAAAALVLLVAIPDQRHWLGKVRFLGSPQSTVGRMDFLEPIGDQLRDDERLTGLRVVVISDPAISTYLVANFRFYSPEYRLNINASSNPVFGRIEGLQKHLDDWTPKKDWTICVIVPKQEPQVPLHFSPVGTLTRHWRAFALNESFQFDPQTIDWCEQNLSDGWQSFDLGEWHKCYLRPSEVKQ